MRRSEKLDLAMFDETDIVNFEDINGNFQKLEDKVFVKEVGTTPVTCTASGRNGTPVWSYEKSTDNKVELTTKINYSRLLCNSKSGNIYYSTDIVIEMPFTLTSIDYVEVHLATTLLNFIIDKTGDSVLGSLTLQLAAMATESADTAKTIFVKVKGTLSEV